MVQEFKTICAYAGSGSDKTKVAKYQHLVEGEECMHFPLKLF
jgi:hypothetical protein